MNASLAEVVRRIPDFDEFLELASKIRDLSFRKLILEKEIKEKESEVFRVMSSDERYFTNGKPPAVSFIENTHRYGGLDGEILPLREEYAKVYAELDNYKMTMDVYKMMVSVFQTMSANERGAGF